MSIHRVLYGWILLSYCSMPWRISKWREIEGCIKASSFHSWLADKICRFALIPLSCSIKVLSVFCAFRILTWKHPQPLQYAHWHCRKDSYRKIFNFHFEQKNFFKRLTIGFMFTQNSNKYSSCWLIGQVFPGITWTQRKLLVQFLSSWSRILFQHPCANQSQRSNDREGLCCFFICVD